MCITADSYMALLALTTFPHLLTLEARFIKAHHIFGFQDDDPIVMNTGNSSINSRKLRHLEYLNVSPGQSIMMLGVLHQEASKREPSLDHICFESLLEQRKEFSVDGLAVRLEAGLGELRVLRKMNEFNFMELDQVMGLQDVCWMVDAWPWIASIYGWFHTDRSSHAALRKVLIQYGIETKSIGTGYGSANFDYDDELTDSYNGG
ncbi:hypothetical protein BX616_008430 [Lobosporangium transversale]|nr:hypothetical protein BX616_008430 [Lobosporangium transversale]